MGRRMPEFLLTKRAESRPAEGKTDSETFMASTAMASHGRRTNAKIFFVTPRGTGKHGMSENVC